MRAVTLVGWSFLAVAFAGGAAASCAASGNNMFSTGGSTGTGGGAGGNGTIGECGSCLGSIYTSCANGQSTQQNCPMACTPGIGCTVCSAQGTTCSGNDVVQCDKDGNPGAKVMTCDASKGLQCSNGACVNGCDLAKDAPSNLGCEFFAVDLDLSDGVSDPAAGPWGVVLSNAGQAPADVVIEQNDAAVGMPISTSVVHMATVQPGSLDEVTLPVRIVDCASVPGDFNSPGTCITSNAFRITSTAPIVVYQFNNFAHGYSTDASLLLPTTSVGTKYRVTGWPVAHSFPSPGAFVQRSYVTVVGTKPNTKVTVKPSWRIKGNGPVSATPAGQLITMTLGPFDVLNLESDDATLQECLSTTPPYCADLTGTIVDATEPVAVFSGTEESGVGLPPDAPTPPDPNSTGCCNQHLEEQLFPVESFGKQFLVTRSPVRSDPNFTWWEEPDILRFVGAAEAATVTTNLPAPFDSFTLMPGEVKDTWTQSDIVVSATQPIVVAQLLVGGDYAEPEPKGDPSFTIFPPIEQARSEYVILSPTGWKEHWVVIGTEPTTKVTVNGSAPTGCVIKPAGQIDGKSYEARRCPLQTGVHRISGDGPFQIMAYGYADADAYAFTGGANLKKIYTPPPLY